MGIEVGEDELKPATSDSVEGRSLSRRGGEGGGRGGRGFRLRDGEVGAEVGAGMSSRRKASRAESPS